MRLISWNVNGIRAICNKKILDLKSLNGDIVCFQETKAQKDQIPTDCLNGYRYFFSNSAEKKGYSGVATLSNVKFIKTDIASKIDPNEGRILEHHFQNIALFNVYFPNGQQSDDRLAYKMKFYDEFLEYCQDLREEGKSIIICGDVNTAHKEIDLKHPKANSERSGFLPIEREWIDKFLAHGYIDTFRQIHGDIKDAYSWWTYRFNARKNNAGWRIDYFFISEDLKPKLKDAFILKDVMGSDHCPVGIDLDISNN